MNKIKRAADMTNLLMLTLLISMAGLFVMDGLTGTDGDLPFLFSGVLILLGASYLMRVAISRLPVFVALHVVLTGLCILVLLLLRDPYAVTAAGFFCALSVILLVADLMFWMNAVQVEKDMPLSENGEVIPRFQPVYKEGFAKIPVTFVALFVITLAYAVYADLPHFAALSYVCGILFVALHLTGSYLQSLSEVLNGMERESALSQKRVLFSNARLGVPVICLLILCMILLQSDQLTALMEKAVFEIVRALFYGVVSVTVFLANLMGRALGDGGSMPSGTLSPEALEETPQWLQVLSRFLEYLLIALLLLGLLFLIIRGIGILLRFYRERSVNRVRTYESALMQETRERIRPSAPFRIRKGHPHHAKTNAGKIRVLYVKYLRRMQKAGLILKPCDTPLEIAEAILKMKEEKAGDFPPSERMRELVIAGLYDKARYTAHPVTDEDLKTMEESV